MDVRTRTWTRTHTRTHTHLVVPQQERQQHEHASIMHNPPDVNAALGEALGVPRKHGKVLGDQQRQVTSSGFPDQLWGRPRRRPNRETGTLVPSCTRQQPQELLAPRTPPHPTPPHLGLGLSSQKTSLYLGLITYLLLGFGKASQPLWASVSPPVQWQQEGTTCPFRLLKALSCMASFNPPNHLVTMVYL